MAYVAITAVAITLSLGACTTQSSKTVTIATHDSFLIPDSLINQFKKETGYSLEGIKVGDAGELTNKLVLTKDAPIADAFFGIDNTFAGVASRNDIVDGNMSAIDYADVCFNYDRAWFASKGVVAPTSWQQLTDSKYKNLTVVENPTTSSTGLAFMFSTIAKLGEPGWKTWWARMFANGMKVEAGWEQAYYVDFSGSAGHGQYPIVLSYSSSPADEVGKDGQSRTVSINQDCFRQIEYAGVLKNAKNPDGARALVAFLKSKAFQSSVAENMYVYPVDKSVALPAAWAKFAPASKSFVNVSKLPFDEKRSTWLDEWSKLAGQ
jgi:thiamine transport system substrate-binding protein